MSNEDEGQLPWYNIARLHLKAKDKVVVKVPGHLNPTARAHLTTILEKYLGKDRDILMLEGGIDIAVIREAVEHQQQELEGAVAVLQDELLVAETRLWKSQKDWDELFTLTERGCGSCTFGSAGGEEVVTQHCPVCQQQIFDMSLRLARKPRPVVYDPDARSKPEFKSITLAHPLPQLVKHSHD